jgi:hypothetical protein
MTGSNVWQACSLHEFAINIKQIMVCFWVALKYVTHDNNSVKIQNSILAIEISFLDQYSQWEKLSLYSSYDHLLACKIAGLGH